MKAATYLTGKRNQTAIPLGADPFYTFILLKDGNVATTNPTIGQFYNPGYEHLKSIYALKDAQTKFPRQAASAYILPLMAMQSACLAIVEYISLVGQKIDPIWAEINWQGIPIQEQIAYIYRKAKQSTRFDTGLWKEVFKLLDTGASISEDLAEMKKLQHNEIPEKLKSIAVEYPIYRSQAIAEEAVDILLDLSDLSNSVNRNVSVEK